MNDSSDAATAAKEILDSMLGYLGFVVKIEVGEHGGIPALQVFTQEADLLTGSEGARLDDLQYLVNRLLQAKLPGAPRIRVDVEHFRTMREDHFLEGVLEKADRVRRTRKPLTLQPMNSYFRRLVHTALKDDPEIKTVSKDSQTKLKAIQLIPKS